MGWIRIYRLALKDPAQARIRIKRIKIPNHPDWVMKKKKICQHVPRGTNLTATTPKVQPHKYYQRKHPWRIHFPRNRPWSGIQPKRVHQFELEEGEANLNAFLEAQSIPRSPFIDDEAEVGIGCRWRNCKEESDPDDCALADNSLHYRKCT